MQLSFISTYIWFITRISLCQVHIVISSSYLPLDLFFSIGPKTTCIQFFEACFKMIHLFFCKLSAEMLLGCIDDLASMLIPKTCGALFQLVPSSLERVQETAGLEVQILHFTFSQFSAEMFFSRIDETVFDAVPVLVPQGLGSFFHFVPSRFDL